MNYELKCNKYNSKCKFLTFYGGKINRQSGYRNIVKTYGNWIPYSKDIYTNVTQNKTLSTLPRVDTWIKYNNNNDTWYVNENQNISEWTLPSNSWLKTNNKYINSTTGEVSNIIPFADVWVKVNNDKDEWYVNTKTNKSEWDLPSNSWEKTFDTWYEHTVTGESLWSIPTDVKEANTFVNEDLELYNPQNAGLSNNIWPIITKSYNIYGKKLSFIGRTDKTNLFRIIPKHINEYDEPILGSGTYTAVYLIKDENLKINDNVDNQYILRIYTRTFDYKDKNMFDYPKVKNEYKLFKNYMSAIYYYGSIYESLQSNPLYIKENNVICPFDYNITKIYKTFSFDKITNKFTTKLTNLQKIMFLLENIKMLDYLSSMGYIHCDYKIENVAYDSLEKMNVILIDYDITTLQPLLKTNTNFRFDVNGNVTKLSVTSTFPPAYISKTRSLSDVIKLPLKLWDKYSIGGLVDMIDNLNIDYNFDELKLDSSLSNGKIKNVLSRDILYSLKLTSNNYNDIPTYKELYEIFNYLVSNNYII